MRILLAHNSLYFPSHGGGDKSNRLLMAALAERGHEVRVVARVESFSRAAENNFLAQLEARGVAPDVLVDGVVRFRLGAVEVRVVASNPNLRGYFAKTADEFDPDVILTSTDDPAQILLEPALKSARARVVYLIRATIAAPFGPDSAFRSEAKTRVLRHVDGAVGVSHYVANYVREQGGVDAIHVPISLLEPQEYPELGRFDNEFVTFVNPCAVKGLTIFTALAEQMPDVKFAAVPTWGSLGAELEPIEHLPNVSILNPVDQIDDLLRRTRVTLVPSVWAEARSRMVLESLVRGVPVIASDAGGLREAMLGVDHILPVNVVTRYHAAVDANMVPIADVPPQNIGPWRKTLEKLVTDRAAYEELAARSRRVGLDYANNLTAEPFERYLLELCAKPQRRRADRAKGPVQLSAEKMKLLALRARHRSDPANKWFPLLENAQPGRHLLVCFPHAGAGTVEVRGWARQLRAGIALCPVRLPGRETRTGETPYQGMRELIEELGPVFAREVLEKFGTDFSFFGHSMGAGIAFELARWLRREGLAMPKRLAVSSVRAPQYRRNWTPPPSLTNDELIARLDGDETMVPVLRTDTELYRLYAYTEEAPLEVPILAMGGEDDLGIQREHLEAWREQTTGDFRLRRWPGGHFYYRDVLPEFLSELGQVVSIR